MRLDHASYVPVLKGKRAEFPALKEIRNKDGVCPLVEGVPSSPADCVTRKMARAWPNDRPYFVDMLFFDDEGGTVVIPAAVRKARRKPGVYIITPELKRMLVEIRYPSRESVFPFPYSEGTFY